MERAELNPTRAHESWHLERVLNRLHLTIRDILRYLPGLRHVYVKGKMCCVAAVSNVFMGPRLLQAIRCLDDGLPQPHSIQPNYVAEFPQLFCHVYRVRHSSLRRPHHPRIVRI